MRSATPAALACLLLICSPVVGTADDVTEKGLNDAQEALKAGDAKKCVEHLDAALAKVAASGKVVNDDEVGPLYLLRGQSRVKLKLWVDAAADLRKAYKLLPDDISAMNDVIWVLSTAPEEKARDGKFALECAKAFEKGKVFKELNRIKNDDDVPNPGYHLLADTLAAAYAEAKDFQTAVKYQRESVAAWEYWTKEVGEIKKDSLFDVIEKSTGKKMKELTADVKERLELYRDKKPFREK